MPHALIADTFESAQKAPVVRHVFVGDSTRKATGFYNAHMKADSFLRECTEKGNFQGKFKCSTKKRMVKVSPRQLEALQTQQLAGVQVHGAGESCPPPSFWRFASTVVAGQLGAIGTGWALKAALKNKHARTRDTVTVVGSLAAFWLVSGATWIALGRKRPDVRQDPDANGRIKTPGTPMRG